MRYSRSILLVLLPFAAGYFLSYFYRTINAVISAELSSTMQLRASDLGLLAAVYFLSFAAMTPAGAQDQSSSGSGNAQAIQRQIQNNLKQAGFTDIQIMPSSFLVRAKDSAANPVIMVINPDSVMAVMEITASTGISPLPQGIVEAVPKQN